MCTRTRWLLGVAALLAAFNALIWWDSAVLHVASTYTPFVPSQWNLAYGLLFAVVIGGLVAWPLWWVLGKLGRLDYKPCWTVPQDYKSGFPPCVAGVIERLVFTLLVAAQFGDVIGAMMLWLGLKLAAAWKPRFAARGVRLMKLQIGAFRALLVGLVSLLFAAIGGKIALGAWW